MMPSGSARGSIDCKHHKIETTHGEYSLLLTFMWHKMSRKVSFNSKPAVFQCLYSIHRTMCKTAKCELTLP